MGLKPITCSVTNGIRIDNIILDYNSVAIKVFIVEEVVADVGDKFEFGHQLKTVLARVMSGTNKTEDGQDIDAMFGQISVYNRVVSSPEVMGTTNTLLKLISKRAAEIYKS